MTTPQTPHISAIRDLVTVEELIERLRIISRDQRTMLLVDCLCDLRDEMLWVMHELDSLDFDACGFLELLSAEDDDDDDDGLDLAVVH
jgi:hypothetical protein